MHPLLAGEDPQPNHTASRRPEESLGGRVAVLTVPLGGSAAVAGGQRKQAKGAVATRGFLLKLSACISGRLALFALRDRRLRPRRCTDSRRPLRRFPFAPSH